MNSCRRSEVRFDIVGLEHVHLGTWTTASYTRHCALGSCFFPTYIHNFDTDAHHVHHSFELSCEYWDNFLKMPILVFSIVSMFFLVLSEFPAPSSSFAGRDSPSKKCCIKSACVVERHVSRRHTQPTKVRNFGGSGICFSCAGLRFCLANVKA